MAVLDAAAAAARVGGGWLREPPARPEPTMTLPRTVADVLAEHVSFEVECIDRMYLNVYVPQLQYATGLVSYIHHQLGKPVAPTAALAPVSEAFSRSVRSFAASCGIPWVDFAKGQRKDDVAQEYLAGFTGTEGVLFIGRAQEKVPLFRTRKRHRADGSSYPWIAAETGVVNQYYCYCVDEDFGPFFLKFCSYFPFNAKLCINGNEWAKRQAAKAGIGFTPMDNAFAAVDDVAALQAICHALGPAQIDALLRKWLARLPHPFTRDDEDADYRWQLSVQQIEFSTTMALDRPVTGRIFFEQLIRDNLDIGRPDKVNIVFDRKIRLRGKGRTPGTFRTQVITSGTCPYLYLFYKKTQVKQYLKEGRALRTETTLNQPRDFGIGKELTNLAAMAEVGYAARGLVAGGREGQQRVAPDARERRLLAMIDHRQLAAQFFPFVHRRRARSSGFPADVNDRGAGAGHVDAGTSVLVAYGPATNFSGKERRFLLYQYRAADAWPLLGLKEGLEKFNEQREKVNKASTLEEESRYSQRTMADIRSVATAQTATRMTSTSPMSSAHAANR